MTQHPAAFEAQRVCTQPWPESATRGKLRMRLIERMLLLPSARAGPLPKDRLFLIRKNNPCEGSAMESGTAPAPLCEALRTPVSRSTQWASQGSPVCCRGTGCPRHKVGAGLGEPVELLQPGSTGRRLVGERATKRLRGGRGWGALALPQCLGSFFQAAAAAVRAGLSEIREGVDPTTPSCLLRPSGCSTVSWRASWDSTADDPERGLL